MTDNKPAVVLYGSSHIADLLGVTKAAVCNWRSRYDDTPPPTHEVVDKMPLWDATGLAAWVAWREIRMSR